MIDTEYYERYALVIERFRVVNHGISHESLKKFRIKRFMFLCVITINDI